MKLLIFPKNYSITLRDSKNELVGSSLITEQTPITFLYSKRKSPTVFESMKFVFDFNNKSIKTKGQIFKENGEIEIGLDEELAFFTFVDTEDIEPCKALRYR